MQSLFEVSFSHVTPTPCAMRSEASQQRQTLSTAALQAYQKTHHPPALW